jgi:hypothetical protein
MQDRRFAVATTKVLLTFDKLRVLSLEAKDRSAMTLNGRQCSNLMGFLPSCTGIYVGNEAKTLRFLGAILWMVRSQPTTGR